LAQELFVFSDRKKFLLQGKKSCDKGKKFLSLYQENIFLASESITRIVTTTVTGVAVTSEFVATTILVA